MVCHIYLDLGFDFLLIHNFGKAFRWNYLTRWYLALRYEDELQVIHRLIGRFENEISGYISLITFTVIVKDVKSSLLFIISLHFLSQFVHKRKLMQP